SPDPARWPSSCCTSLFYGLFCLRVWPRLLAGLVFLLVLMFFAARLVKRLAFLRLGEDEVALAIERQTTGGIENRLINALQISRGAGAIPAPLAPALVRENFDQLEKAVLPRAAPSRPALLKAGLALLLVT